MLKSNIIDAKYRDAKGEYRTPSIVTSVTEDEIKNASFAPGDILPASAVQVAVNAAGGNPFPFTYTKKESSQYTTILCDGSRKNLVFNNEGSAGDKSITINPVDGVVKVYEYNGHEYLTAMLKPESLSFSCVLYGKSHECTFGHNKIELYSGDETGYYKEPRFRVDEDGTLVLNSTSYGDASVQFYNSLSSDGYQFYMDDVAIDKHHLETLQKVLTNSSKSISDVDTGAALSALISSYNSLLAHLRTSGILKA